MTQIVKTALRDTTRRRKGRGSRQHVELDEPIEKMREQRHEEQLGEGRQCKQRDKRAAGVSLFMSGTRMSSDHSNKSELCLPSHVDSEKDHITQDGHRNHKDMREQNLATRKSAW